MMTNETARSRGISLVWSAVLRAIRLLTFGLIGWLLFVSATGSAWRAVSLAAVLALAALVGITWYLSRARAERRWRAALDAYAEKELAKRTLTRGGTFMLVLRRKIGERIVVPHFGFAVRVIAIEGKTVRLGISAPEDVAVYREEPTPPANPRPGSCFVSSFLRTQNKLEESGIIDQGNPRGLPSRAPFHLGNGRFERGLTTERSFMSDNNGASCNRDILLENLAAELTRAAYAVALRQGMAGSWIKVELDLWRELAQTIKKWARQWPPAGRPDEFEVWQESLLVDLTESAFYVAVKRGIKGSLFKVELCLYRTFRFVIRRVGTEALRCRMTVVRHS